MIYVLSVLCVLLNGALAAEPFTIPKWNEWQRLCAEESDPQECAERLMAQPKHAAQLDVENMCKLSTPETEELSDYKWMEEERKWRNRFPEEHRFNPDVNVDADLQSKSSLFAMRTLCDCAKKSTIDGEFDESGFSHCVSGQFGTYQPNWEHYWNHIKALIPSHSSSSSSSSNIASTAAAVEITAAPIVATESPVVWSDGSTTEAPMAGDLKLYSNATVAKATANGGDGIMYNAIWAVFGILAMFAFVFGGYFLGKYVQKRFVLQGYNSIDTSGTELV